MSTAVDVLHEAWCTDHLSGAGWDADNDPGMCMRKWQTTVGTQVVVSYYGPDGRGPLIIEVAANWPDVNPGEARELAALLVEAAEMVEGLQP